MALTDYRSVHDAANDQYVQVKTATIARNGTRSNAVMIDGLAPVRIAYDGNWMATAPIVHVRVSETSTGLLPLWKASTSTAYTVPAVKSRAYQLASGDFAGVNYIRLLAAKARGTAVSASATAVHVSIVCKLL